MLKVTVDESKRPPTKGTLGEMRKKDGIYRDVKNKDIYVIGANHNNFGFCVSGDGVYNIDPCCAECEVEEIKATITVESK